MTGFYPESQATVDLLVSHAADWNRVLYIGWHPAITADGGGWYMEYIRFRRGGLDSEHTVLERYRPYYERMLEHPLNKRYKVRGLNVDVVEWAPVTEDRFDLIIWWHGPEHITAAQLVPTLQALERIGKYLILGGPEGVDNSYPVPEEGSGDSHKCVLSRKQFEELGYQTALFDRTIRGQGPHISAVKIV